MKTMSSQERYLRTGRPNSFRVRGERGNWWVESTDNNNVWLDAEGGVYYRAKREAIDALRELADD